MKPQATWDRNEVEAITGSAMTKSDKMRALARLGLPRARIADALGVKYQFVRNVLEGDRPRKLADTPAPGVSEGTPQPFAVTPPRTVKLAGVYRLTVGAGGVVTLPPEVLEAFGVPEGGTVVADFEAPDRFTLISAREGVRRIRALVPQWRPGEPLASEELIAERRQEARLESDG